MVQYVVSFKNKNDTRVFNISETQLTRLWGLTVAAPLYEENRKMSIAQLYQEPR